MKVDTQNNLSFLDTLSCGLGGLMALFFIFAALKDEGAVASKTIPVLIKGDKPLVVTQVGTDKKLPPVYFYVKLASDLKCAVATDKNDDDLLLAKSNGFTGNIFRNQENQYDELKFSTYFGTYWGEQSKDIVVKFIGCSASTNSNLIEVGLIKSGLNSACDYLVKGKEPGIHRVLLKVENSELIRVNSTRVDKVNEKRC